MQKVIGFQGIHGANSENAIFQHFGQDNIETYPCSDLDALFKAIHNEEITSALVPVENAFAGAVNGAYELLMDYDLRIQAEVIHHVHHALVALPGTSIDDLTHVRSHPQALAQCERFLLRQGLTPVTWYDTAGAAKDLAAEQTPNVGALSSTRAAEIYKLDVLAESVEDVTFNFTRFFLLGHTDPVLSDYNKTSLVFATRHHPGALYECLGTFAEQGLNLTKLESRPRRNRPWEPVFHVDFEGHWQEPNVQSALTALLQKASFVKMLGSYPAAKNNSVGM
ncbi:MAG: prephenate dehydratase [Phototrophicaceae bacterium]